MEIEICKSFKYLFFDDYNGKDFIYYISVNGEELEKYKGNDFLTNDDITLLIFPYDFREIAISNNALIDKEEIFFNYKKDAEKVKGELNKILKSLKVS